VGGAADIESREIAPFLTSSEKSTDRPLELYMDAALAERILANASRERMLIRAYNLEDPRSSDLRTRIGPLSPSRQSYFLTVKP
jgi:hypothetical protein